LVLLADASKGALPVLVLGRWFADPWFPALGGIAAVFGQVFSVFLGGRGGKGVATSLGAGLALAPLPALACGGIFAVLFALFRIASVGSLAAVVTFPACLYLFDLGTRPRLVFAATIAVLVIIRHKDNLVRLLNGQENRV
jgi:glycerol-3-phosphate acyltransferase PlsY